jgi:hypothetical protein
MTICKGHFTSTLNLTTVREQHEGEAVSSVAG